MATGVSGGAAHRMPSLFFKDKTLDWLRSLKNPFRQADDKLDGEECYVISGDDTTGQEILWITKKNFLLKQMKSVFGGSGVPNEAARSVSDLSDESLKKMMKMTGQEPTPDAMRKFRKSIEETAKMAGQIRGSITQTFQRIVVDELMEKEDFDYQIPKNASH